MKLRAEQLAAHLQQPLLPVYVISGDEPLLVQEACDAICHKAREQGFLRQRLVIESPNDWQQLVASAASLSLFSSRELLSIQLVSPKIGDVGSKVLRAYAEQPARDKIIVLCMGKLEAAIAQSSWIKALDKIGVIITLWPLTGGVLTQWLRARAHRLGLQLTPGALQVLAERTAGNLLASAQELEKLALLASNTLIDERMLMACVYDHAQFSIFDVVDFALAGNLHEVVRGLAKLQTEQAEPTLVLWCLTKQLRELMNIAELMAQGTSVEAAMKHMRIWATRQGLVKKALLRQDIPYWQQILSQAATTDRLIKGVAVGDVWDSLLVLYEQLVGVSVITCHS